MYICMVWMILSYSVRYSLLAMRETVGRGRERVNGQMWPKSVVNPKPRESASSRKKRFDRSLSAPLRCDDSIDPGGLADWMGALDPPIFVPTHCPTTGSFDASSTPSWTNAEA